MAIGKLKALGTFAADGGGVTGDSVQLDPVPGPATIVAIDNNSGYDDSVQLQGSHDNTNFVNVNAAITGEGGFDLIAPWPFIRAVSTGGGSNGESLTLTLFYVFDD